MHYLSSSLTGPALECISNLPITSDSFPIAWETLKSRYENKRLLLYKHFDSLFELPFLARESVSDLQLLCDKTSSITAALKNLDRTTEQLWNDILVYIISKKLDPATRKAWRLRSGDRDELPCFDDLVKFLVTRTQALEEDKPFSSSIVRFTGKSPLPRRVASASAVANSIVKCQLCDAKHYLNACPKFLNLSPSQRREIVRKFNRRFNYLSKSHSAHDCKSKYTCRVCQKRHHSLLHVASDSPPPEFAIASSSQTDNAKKEISALCSTAAPNASSKILLATAKVSVRASSGRVVVARALLDQGSEMSFITENLAQLLHVRRFRMSVEVSAVGGIKAGVYQHAIQISISPRDSTTPTFSTTAVIMKKLTNYLPPRVQFNSALDHLIDLHWADDSPLSSEPISLIIGAELYSELLLEGVRKGTQGQPIAQNTVLGWVISGPLSISNVTSMTSSTSYIDNLSALHVSTHHCLQSVTLDQEIRRFWEIEEIPSKSILSPLEEQCELHFQRTHTRRIDSRYVVRLPFKEGPPIDIGKSRHRAESMLRGLHRRFQIHPEMKCEYTEFLRDYEQQRHMKEASRCCDSHVQCVFIPHHPVLRDKSVTTHLRVVFNASGITTNGTTLNEHLLIGPKLQNDLSAVMLQWRQYKFVYSADIKQMYRQIIIDPRDAGYQPILWNPNSAETPREYQLLTVTYGMASAPYLALRVLQQLADDEGDKFPLAVSILREKIYVDDVLFGHDNKTVLKQTRDQLRSLLARGGFHLHKWSSNASDLLTDISNSNENSSVTKLIQADERLNILGLTWNSAHDSFQFEVASMPSLPETKRTILSLIAKLFEPLGWVTPVTINAKVFMQSLWRLKLGWDERVPVDILNQWKKIYASFTSLRGLQVTRWTGQGSHVSYTEVHGFADASSVAFAASVYIKIVDQLGNATITLLTGKSKVAPVSTVSIPRLELSAAVLLSRLINFVQSVLPDQLSYFCWTDSAVVLVWLKQPVRMETLHRKSNRRDSKSSA